jgi:hypothetical protein
MFKEITLLQWKTSRFAVMSLLPFCFALPIFLVRLGQRLALSAPDGVALQLLRFIDATSVAFPVLAGATGCTLALTAWAWDHRTHHVYALSLPIERWRYALMKMGAGVLIMLPLAAALLVGCLIAFALTDLPVGVRGYPVSIALRFLFAALICYAITFAFASGTTRTTVRVFTALFVIVIVGSVVTEIAGRATGTAITTPAALLGEAMVKWPGPFNVFGGNWMLIDV